MLPGHRKFRPGLSATFVLTRAMVQPRRDLRTAVPVATSGFWCRLPCRRA